MQVFGHRGSPGFPRFGENTRTSFKKALDAGAAGFELDVRRCGDGTIIVIHDATVDRTTTGRGRISDLSYDQLARFDAGFGDSIPRLSDILDQFGSACTIHVELKEGGLASDVAAMIRERSLESHVLLSAFDADDSGESATSSWSDLSAISSTITTSLLISRRKFEQIGAAPLIDAAKRHGARGIHPQREPVTSFLIDSARGADLAVRVWTINDPLEAVRMRDIGVDAIFTDRPELCLNALRQ